MKTLQDSTVRKAVYVATFILWAVALVFLGLCIDFRKLIPQFSAGILILAVINAIIAKERKKSWLLWFVLTLFLGPFATILLLLL